MMKNNKHLNIDFEQLRNIIINVQGNSDPTDICIQYGTDAKTLLNTIEVIRPAIRAQSLKNRLTRLSTKLLESIELENHEETNPDKEDLLSSINHASN